MPRTGTSERRPAAESAVEPPACMCREKKASTLAGYLFRERKNQDNFCPGLGLNQSGTKIILVFCFMRAAIFWALQASKSACAPCCDRHTDRGG